MTVPSSPVMEPMPTYGTAAISTSTSSLAFQMLLSTTPRKLEAGAWAAQHLPADAKTSCINLQGSLNCRMRSLSQAVMVSVQNGTLDSINDDWFLQMEVATDCRAQNVECCFSSEYDSVTFRTTRAVDKGEKLVFWFSSPMLAKLEMPFLRPVNIQGGERYVCHRCSAVFKAPNPLKLHIYFSCSPVSLESLWKKVELALQRPPLPELGSSSKYTIIAHLERTTTLYPSIPPSFVEKSTTSSPAEVESLVSNLGRSRLGHLCIYCGKVYSRKYGLKIHIRTHTGYKPLKCPICSRPFGDPSNLNKHIRLHADGNTPYRCDLCGKVLVRRRDLERHQKSRHPQPSTSALPDSSTETLSGETDSQNSSHDVDSSDEDISIDVD